MAVSLWKWRWAFENGGEPLEIAVSLWKWRCAFENTNILCFLPLRELKCRSVPFENGDGWLCSLWKSQRSAFGPLKRQISLLFPLWKRSENGGEPLEMAVSLWKWRWAFGNSGEPLKMAVSLWKWRWAFGNSGEPLKIPLVCASCLWENWNAVLFPLKIPTFSSFFFWK